MTLVALKARRLTVGLSQEALARRAGCSLSMVRVVEGGYRASDDLATRLAHALDCEPEDLHPVDPLITAARSTSTSTPTTDGGKEMTKVRSRIAESVSA